MELGKVYKERTPDGRTRLCAKAIYGAGVNANKESELFYFEYPEDIEDSLVDSGDPWLTLFLPISVALGETLRITKPVDPLLLEGCLEALEIWRSWMGVPLCNVLIHAGIEIPY
jgi:hypothetical protein